MSGREIVEDRYRGFDLTIDMAQGRVTVAHDGNITWDELQDIKNYVWGDAARAIEVFPAQSKVVNSGNYRHLWRLGPGDFCPDLLGDDEDDSLAGRYARSWAEARA